ncbi:uncharacterized protein LOC143217879 [Lasioglossum baleicum]|uniref:uncharacterized protein LOC143217879 n=1 Tax=Lasioglossum baleicum TaxID=434251 RepID=UPI003FCC5B25
MDFAAEELLLVQQDLLGKIQRTMDNFKKSVPQSNIILEKHWTQSQQNHTIIMYKKRDPFKSSDYVKDQVADLAEETYVQQRSILHDLMLQYSGKGKRSEAPQQTEDSGSAPLPRVPFPHFHGEYVNWPAFKDLFMSIIERHKDLSDVERLHYLKASLHGQAADLVKDIPTTNDNYKRACNILLGQYENKRILVRSCLDKLTAQPKMKESSEQEMTIIQKGVSTVVNTLEGLGRPINKSEDWFVYSIVNLFDDTSRDKWEEKVTNSTEPPSFADLQDFMLKRLQMLQAKPAARSIRPIHAGPGQPGPGQFGPREFTRKAKINHAQQDSNKVICVVCSKGHYLMNCPDYKATPVDERRRQVELHQLCINCLGKHNLESCPSTKSCFTCQERHHCHCTMYSKQPELTPRK